ncbi:CpaF family protein [Vibrio vulnificus]|uniref:CpaF family protein n=1 Tax=Vibrio vulnificus TaxID=672 RepID=UPI00102A5EC8|nr:CpaF family protein [Vibrio vulnificus]EMA2413059.1 CpaF family protein [Vibrio vulnificus]RZP57490.1 CpaF family protein [Vibrio vulnificus]
MFGHKTQLAHASRGNPLVMPEAAQAAFEKLIEPSEAVKLSRAQLQQEIKKAVGQMSAQQLLPYNQSELAVLVEQLCDDMLGVGPIQCLVEDPSVSDILVNGPEQIYIERHGKLLKTDIRFRDKKHLLNVAQRIVNAVGRRLDESTPLVDARLEDGSRVNIIAPPLALNGVCISIRKFPERQYDLPGLVAFGSMSEEMAECLALAARCRFNILVSGGTGAGKTTLLNAMSTPISEDERIITIEDAAELSLTQPHWIQLETRTASSEGTGAVTVRDLVKNALRMRPDRIILGEVRGAEAFDMLQAMNTGHDGSLCTLHANSPADAMLRLENMLMMGAEQIPSAVLRQQISSALDLVVQLERSHDGKRRVTAISAVGGLEEGQIAIHPLFDYRLDEEGCGDYHQGILPQGVIERARHFALDKAWSSLFSTVGG